uniref:Uncharacterized protein n=1 Tax=Physcomitrium patens TaxID=3218 RepID=A0A2K1KT15_PHYPA|nr:hypothetical protein PHYPA_003918 [Physcomitrium patens]
MLSRLADCTCNCSSANFIVTCQESWVISPPANFEDFSLRSKRLHRSGEVLADGVSSEPETSKMVGMKITSGAVLVICLLVGTVYGFVVNEKPEDGWKYSVNGWGDSKVSKNQFVRESQYQSISFDDFDPKELATNAEQFAENTFSDIPQQIISQESSYIYNARRTGDHQLTQASFDYPTNFGGPGSHTQDTKTSLSTTNEQPNGEPAKGHEGPISFYTPSSNNDGVFSFVNPGGSVSSAFSVSEAANSQPADKSGCSSSYWATHIEQWPKVVNVYTLVTAALGGQNVGSVYGTTTLFQALLDTRNDPYSKLLRHSVAALLNAITKPSYKTRPNVVIDKFNKALISSATAAAPAQTFENENHSYGFNECSN